MSRSSRRARLKRKEPKRGMRVLVDHDLCESNGVCEGIAPDIFRVDDDDGLQILEEDVGREDLDKVKDAVARCPKAALRVED